MATSVGARESHSSGWGGRVVGGGEQAPELNKCIESSESIEINKCRERAEKKERKEKVRVTGLLCA